MSVAQSSAVSSFCPIRQLVRQPPSETAKVGEKQESRLLQKKRIVRPLVLSFEIKQAIVN